MIENINEAVKVIEAEQRRCRSAVIDRIPRLAEEIRWQLDPDSFTTEQRNDRAIFGPETGEKWPGRSGCSHCVEHSVRDHIKGNSPLMERVGIHCGWHGEFSLIITNDELIERTTEEYWEQVKR
jgi:hypothetical protein